MAAVDASWLGELPFSPAWGRLDARWAASSTQWVLPLGLPAPEPPAPAHLTQTRFIGAQGWQSGSLGDTWVLRRRADGKLLDWRPGQWVVNASWAGAEAYAPGAGWVAPRWNADIRTLRPGGIAAPDVGAPRVFGSQFIRPAGIAPPPDQVGGHGFVLHPWQYAVPQWVLNASWVGAQVHAPAGNPVNVAWSLPADASQISVTGWDSAQFGTPALPVLSATGWDAALFGNPSLALGAAALHPAGWDAALVGKPGVRHAVRFAQGKGWDAALFGAHKIEFLDRSIKPQGIESAALGSPVISHEVRALGPVGEDFMRLGQAWVSHSPRSIGPQGIGPWADVATHMVGTKRWITPGGFVATLWGTRIRPEWQEVEGKGFRADLFGQAHLHSTVHNIRPPAMAWPDEPARFGLARVWNKVQYIHQAQGDEWDGLHPPPMDGWTLVQNRNRALGVSGWDAAKVGGGAWVHHGARALLAAGIAAPDETLPPWKRRGMVSHAVRSVAPQGLDAPLISGWTAVWCKAYPLQPDGWDAASLGVAKLENTRRTRKVQGWESEGMGAHMVSFAVRGITFPWGGIAPPYIPLPTVQHYTRRVYPGGISGGTIYGEMKVGTPVVESRFNRITPRWVQQHDIFGTAEIHNVTPEHRAFGWDAALWGDAQVRLQWRALPVEGEVLGHFGKARIADRKQALDVPSLSDWGIGLHTVTRLGPGALVTQYIDLRILGTNQNTGEITEAEEGHGIWPPGDQVPGPDLTRGHIRPLGIDSLKMGSAKVTANTIRVAPGLYEFKFGEPLVSHRHRSIAPKSIGQLVKDSEGPLSMRSWGLARLSPHTIYPFADAPQQAKANHPSNTIWPVNAGAKPGKPTVALASPPPIQPAGILGAGDELHGQVIQMGRATVFNKRQYVHVDGIRAARLGWPSLPGKQRIDCDGEGFEAAALGKAQVGFPPSGDSTQWIGLAGLDGLKFGPLTRVENLHRSVQAKGWHSQAFGRSEPPDTRYMWQSLHVGPREKPPMQGWDAAAFGLHFVSLRVRNVQVAGWDAFVMDHDPQHFGQRLRVRRRAAQPGVQVVGGAGGIAPARVGQPDARNRRRMLAPFAICPVRGTVARPTVAHV